jgi:hypothetical protein
MVPLSPKTPLVTPKSRKDAPRLCEPSFNEHEGTPKIPEKPEEYWRYGIRFAK